MQMRVGSDCLGCSGYVFFSMGANVFAMCWYSCCSFIVFGVKYMLALFCV